MERSIPELMVISVKALTIVSYSAMLLACGLFIVALVKFYRASKTKLRSDYSKAFRFSGHGFLILGFLQAILLSYLDSQLKINASYAAMFFIAIGIITAFIGDRLKPKR
jgi:hypothetical protein